MYFQIGAISKLVSFKGPLLFLIHINDIVDGIKSPIKLFADDTSLFVTIDKNETEPTDQLNADLKLICKWSKSWLVTFNPEKSKHLVISLKRKPNQIPLLFDNRVLESVECHKHLGLTLNSSLHIDEIYIGDADLITWMTDFF